MGLTTGQQEPFTHTDVLNKELVIRMLQFEEKYTFSEAGQDLYRNPLNEPLQSLFVEKTLNRVTLSAFGYSTSEESVNTFRSVFRTYFKSPTDYDADVINSIHYFRGNKVVFYTQPIIQIGDTVGNCRMLSAEGRTDTNLYSQLIGSRYTLIQPFSMS